MRDGYEWLNVVHSGVTDLLSAPENGAKWQGGRPQLYPACAFGA